MSEVKGPVFPEAPKQKKNGCLKYLLVALGIFLVFALMVNVFSDNDSTENTASADSTKSEQPTEKEEVKTWAYEEKIDEMTDFKNRWATLESDNYIEQEFPYEGETYATITARETKEYGTDVMIRITKGQIVGHEFTGDNYVTVRFDDAEAKKYYFNESADLSTEVVFLKKSKDFIEQCKKAKEIKIELPLFQGGRPLFKFHVDKSLEW